jgi:hypothetical protein
MEAHIRACTHRNGDLEAVAAGKQELLAVVRGHRLAEIRRSRGLTQQDVLVRYAAALGGRLHQSIYFDDGDIAAIA